MIAPAALAPRCLGLVLSLGSWRRRRRGHGLAGLIASCLGLAYVVFGIVVGLAFL